MSQNPRSEFIRDWMTTGDQGIMDGDGYIAFLGRDDDVITSSGYRIGLTPSNDACRQYCAKR